MEKTNIELSSSKINLIFKSLAFAIITIFIFNHFGSFYNRYDNYQSNDNALIGYGTITPETTVILIYKSPFGTKLEHSKIFKPADTWVSGEGVDSYFVKGECYFMALIQDFLYVTILSVLIWLGFYFFSKHKISIK